MQDSGTDRLLRRGLKLSHLRLLSALGQTGQLSAAAARLAISQPAASRLLSEAERISGTTLHKRHARGVEFTEAGQYFVTFARRMLGDLDAAARDIEELDAGRRGFVSIGAVTGAALEHVLPVLRQLRVTHPRINANVVVDTSDKLAPLLLADQLDLYIGRIPAGMDHSAFVAEPASLEPISLIVRKDHPLKRNDRLTLEQCVEFDWVMQPIGGLLRQTMETYLEEKRVALPTRVISTSSMLMTLALIASSNAIAPVARAAAAFFGGDDGLGASIVALPIAPDLAVAPYSLLRPAHRNLSPTSRLVHEQIRARLAVRVGMA